MITGRQKRKHATEKNSGIQAALEHADYTTRFPAPSVSPGFYQPFHIRTSLFQCGALLPGDPVLIVRKARLQTEMPVWYGLRYGK
jgi:hypothetical protein